ncbi:MAG: F0F1 ATP synthase subunit gamma [Myxococcales bacterium]|nr:F0F1 ATP synthase subunit gamma [Myxococcales bacterium]
MKRELELGRRLHSLETLGDAVSAMKSLSAHHFRETRDALEPARTYREGVLRLAEATGAELPAGDGPIGLLVIGAELGLCGSYNSSIAAAGAERRHALGPGPTFCVGRRAATLLSRHDVELERAYAAPTSTRGITDVLLSVARDMIEAYVSRRMSGFEVLSSRFEGVGLHRPTTTALLPFRAAPPSGPVPVARYARPGRLAAVAVRELFFATMYELLLDALAAEHGARLAATQSAERWLDERTDKLRRHLSAARREASTQEVLEIAAGARARERARDL